MDNPNRVVILVESLYISEEIEIYRECFERSGYEVKLAANLLENKSITVYSDNVSDIPTSGSTPLQQLTVDVDIKNVEDELSKCAAVLVAANYTSVRLRYFTPQQGEPRNAPAVRLIQKAMKNPRIVKGALCHALWLLTPSPEVLAGRRVTCHEVVRADIVNAGAVILANKKVVVDGDLVTGYSKHEARELADGIIGQIARIRCGEELRAGSADETSRFTLPDKICKRFILMVLSERGYWGEELIGCL